MEIVLVVVFCSILNPGGYKECVLPPPVVIVKLLRNKLSFAILLSLSIFTLSASLFAPIASAAIQSRETDLAQCLQPPSASQLDHLSDADLAKYGLPPHDAKMPRQDWLNVIAHAKNRLCSPMVNTQIPPSFDTFNEGDRWTANIAYGYTDTFNYKEVYASWRVPCASNDRWSHKESSIWVGLGGDPNDSSNTTEFIQGGSLTTVDYWGNSNYYLMYQNYNSLQSLSTVFQINCGDTVFAEVYQSASRDTSGAQAYVYLQDWTLNKYGTEGPFRTTQLSDGTTAEWAEEAPCQDYTCGSEYDHARFSSFTFSNSEAVTSSGQYLLVGQTTHNYSVQTGLSSGRNLSNIGGIYPSGYPAAFDVSWANYN